jgi:hypothetical protein
VGDADWQAPPTQLFPQHWPADVQVHAAPQPPAWSPRHEDPIAQRKTVWGIPLEFLLLQ